MIAEGPEEDEGETEIERPLRSQAHAVAVDEESSDEEELDDEVSWM